MPDSNPTLCLAALRRSRLTPLRRLIATCLMAAMAAAAATFPASAQDADEASLDQRIQDLKQEVLSLNRDLFLLEEELLFPANTQVVVFVSMDVGTLFQLDSVELKLDDKRVASHLYTEREVAALRRGGVQQIFIGNLPAGEHELVGLFTGKGPHGRDYRRGTTLKFEKQSSAQFIELKIMDDASKQQPQFQVKQWR